MLARTLSWVISSGFLVVFCLREVSVRGVTGA